MRSCAGIPGPRSPRCRAAASSAIFSSAATSAGRAQAAAGLHQRPGCLGAGRRNDLAEQAELHRASRPRAGQVDDVEPPAAGGNEATRQLSRACIGRDAAVVVALHQSHGAAVEQVDGADQLHAGRRRPRVERPGREGGEQGATGGAALLGVELGAGQRAGAKERWEAKAVDVGPAGDAGGIGIQPDSRGRSRRRRRRWRCDLVPADVRHLPRTARGD